MTAQIAAYGRLVADPQLKTTSKGTQMAMASMAIPLPCSQADVPFIPTVTKAGKYSGAQGDTPENQQPVKATGSKSGNH